MARIPEPGASERSGSSSGPKRLFFEQSGQDAVGSWCLIGEQWSGHLGHSTSVRSKSRCVSMLPMLSFWPVYWLCVPSWNGPRRCFSWTRSESSIKSSRRRMVRPLVPRRNTIIRVEHPNRPRSRLMSVQLRSDPHDLCPIKSSDSSCRAGRDVAIRESILAPVAKCGVTDERGSKRSHGKSRKPDVSRATGQQRAGS